MPNPRQRLFRHKGFLLAVLILIVMAAWGIVSRVIDSHSLHTRTEDQAVANVSVIEAKPNENTEELMLPGTVEAWHQASIYARTNGYVKRWYKGMGKPVQAGELLAEIETPEVDAALRQAEADVATAAANNQLAQSTAERWRVLLKTDSVSKQEADEKIADAAAKAAAMASARANRDRLREMESFKRVTAPFDGIVTARLTDNGALINAGASSGPGQELFRVADSSRLRIYVQVPENDTPAITLGMNAAIYFPAYPGRAFSAPLHSAANALDPTARTLLTEFVLDNANGELIPGGYAEVHMTLAAKSQTIRLPVSTLIFRADGMQVAVVGADGKAELKSITIGRDFGNAVEVVSGISAGEKVIESPPDSLANGQAVHVVEPQKNDKAS